MRAPEMATLCPAIIRGALINCITTMLKAIMTAVTVICLVFNFISKPPMLLILSNLCIVFL